MIGYNVAIVSPGELPGQELLKFMAQRRFPISSLQLLEGPAGFATTRRTTFAGRELELKEITSRAFRDVDIVFFCGNGELANQFAPSASEMGALVIDLSGHFRSDDKTPGIIPEVNAAELQNLKKRRIVASPSPAVIQLLLPLNTFRNWTSIKRLTVHSFEPVSENGQSAMELFSAEVRQVMEGKNVVPHAYSHQIAFNILPETENALDTGLSRSEWRIIREIRRIWKLPDLNISVMCLRVPLFIGMSQSVQVDFGRRVTPDEIREVLGDTPGVRLLDDPSVSMYPHPWQAINQDDVLVGRVRELDSNHNSLALWSVMDNLRRGSALNAIRIAESAIEQKII
ncbi:MAG TPA: aspartate-semialdehyde dehydrogenase [Chloroflexia bacterium]|nr:aspartate-semialdehyde dehydrogenase [Chloroflexia bacterium]